MVSATEAIADGPSGILMESVLEGMAEYYKYLVKEKHEGIISKQIIRSATSIGANANEAVYGISKADFIAKLQISLKETFPIINIQIRTLAPFILFDYL